MKISILKQVAGLFFMNIIRSVLRDSSGPDRTFGLLSYCILISW